MAWFFGSWGLILLAAFVWRRLAKLGAREGVRLRSRAGFVAFFICSQTLMFMVFSIIFQDTGQGLGSVVGLVAAVPLVLWGRHRMDRQIQGSVFYRRRYPRYQRYVIPVFFTVAGIAAVTFDWHPRIPHWVLFAAMTASALAALDLFVHVQSLEQRLGQPIIEQEAMN